MFPNLWSKEYLDLSQRLGIVLHHIVKEGKPFNWSDLLAQKLRVHVSNSKNPSKGKKSRFYMFSYLLDAIFTQYSFPNVS